MDKNKKAIVWLLIFIFVIVLSVGVGTYAYFTAKEIRLGNFDVDVTSNGVDMLQFFNNKDINMRVNAYNFDMATGHNVTDDSLIQARLETNKKTSDIYCYTINVTLPDEEVFHYNMAGKPELVMSISESTDNKNFKTLIDNLDVTIKTGEVNVPTSKAGDEYVFKISTTKGKVVNKYYKLSLTMVYYSDIDQSSNFDYTYHAKFQVNRVDC